MLQLLGFIIFAFEARIIIPGKPVGQDASNPAQLFSLWADQIGLIDLPKFARSGL